MATLRFFDSHTHLNSPAFEKDCDRIWEESRQSGVESAIIVGYDLANSERAIELCRRLRGTYAAVGVSPHDSVKAPEDYLDRIRFLAQDAAVVAIGEIGLEYHHPIGRHDIQQKLFQEQVALAKELDLPIIVHSRECESDLVAILTEQKPRRGVLHCYTGSLQTMEIAIELGLHISFSGIVTFSKDESLRQCVADTPTNRLLIETDCPYLAPSPHRGKRCVPQYLIHIAESVAAIRQNAPHVIADSTFQNALDLFKIEQ
ncbi:MAG TPA: TatD family hydrolase [bacterium]|nr:TatD family hydrolase [bacterium]HQO35496.1 TatD family hydrolase [bacterium]HQP98182.1 TatD family hydrolase [bacterium]